MPIKQWTLFSLLGTAFFLITVVTFNVWLDPYGIAHPEKRTFFTQPNVNFLKTKYIMNHPDQYSYFLFGSSRVGNIDTSQLKGGKFYNMTYPDGLPKEHLQNLKHFVQAGVKIEQDYIGLDEFNRYVSYVAHQTQALTRAHPDGTILSWVKFYLFYFFRFPDKMDVAVFKHTAFKNTVPLTMGIENQAQFFKRFDKLNASIDAEKELHESAVVFKHSQPHLGQADRDPIKDIQALINFCRANDIRIIFFLNPIHHVNYADLDTKAFNDFKIQLQNITDYYDFSGPNRVTKENYYFYEPIHYRPIVGEMILNSLLKHKRYDGFGAYVLKSNNASLF